MNRQSLEDAIVALSHIIEDPAAIESDFQKWFETNPVIFEVLQYKTFLVHPHLSENGKVLFTPDFMGKRIDSLWDIIEIKKADTQVLKDTVRRKAFYAEMNTYLSQACEYSEYFDDKAHRKEFKKAYNQGVQKRPDPFLVAGRSNGLDRREVKNILSRFASKVAFQTYDDVFNSLEFARLSLVGKRERLRGLAVGLVMSFERPADSKETYIFDIGHHSDRNRISAFSSPNGDLNFVVYDNNGTRQSAVVARGQEAFDYGQTVYVYMEAGSGENGMMVVQVNGVYCSEVAIRKLNLSLESPMTLVVGSDQSGKAPASMRIAEQVICTSTLSFRDRLNMEGYVANKHGEWLGTATPLPRQVSYLGHAFMYNEGHPLFVPAGYSGPCSLDQIQPVAQHRPIWSNGDAISRIRNLATLRPEP